MCVKFPLGDLDPNPCRPHPLSTYTCKVTIALMWCFIRGNILGFLGMFKDSHVWLQITPGNQMLGESGFPPLNPSQ